MRHNKHRHVLGVKKQHRAALMANLATSLIIHGRIQTTLAKAKATRPFVEKLITLAKKAKASESKTAPAQPHTRKPKAKPLNSDLPMPAIIYTRWKRRKNATILKWGKKKAPVPLSRRVAYPLRQIVPSGRSSS